MKLHKGLTLLEVLLYIAFVALIVGVMGALFITVMQARVRFFGEQELRRSAQHVERVMEVIMSNSSGALLPASGVSASSLTLSLPNDLTNNPTVFSTSGGVLSIQQGLQSATPLTGAQVEVTSFAVTNVSQPATSSLIKVDLTLESTNQGPGIVIDPYSTSFHLAE